MAISTIPSAGITGGGFTFRNLIINGDMNIAQRSTSTSSYSGISYSTVDRFKTVFEYGTYTVSRESLSSGAAYNAGFRTAFKALVTSTASPGAAGEQVTFEQRIEGQMCQALKKGTSNAESLTLSFWVRSSKTGTNLQVNLRDNDNDRIIGATYDINTADTWEKKTITFAGDTSGALDNDNALSLMLEWWLDGGSNYSGGSVPTSWQAKDNTDRNVTNFDLAGGTDDWWITGVQLEAGTTASDFEFLPYDVNFSRCARYYYETPISFAGYAASASLTAGNTFPVMHPTIMRATPSVTGTVSFSANYSTFNLRLESEIVSTINLQASGGGRVYADFSSMEFSAEL